MFRVFTQMDEFETWLGTESKQQQGRRAHEEPTLLSTSVDWRVEALRKPFNRLKARKKPKPPPSPKRDGAERNDTAADGTADPAGGEPELRGAQPEGQDSFQLHPSRRLLPMMLPQESLLAHHSAGTRILHMPRKPRWGSLRNCC